jgi:hypothetical protein
MADNEPNQENSGNAPEGGESSALDSVHLFLDGLKDLFPRELLKDAVRITPHGLFVEKGSFQKVIEGYQAWLRKRTGGTVVKSVDKCVKRLFGSHEPPQFYLVEGKQCLLGYMVPCEVQQPQKYNLPFYLGSLLDTREYLHPRDPFLMELRGVEVTPKPQGVEVKFTAQRRSIRVAADVLKQFSQLAANSHKLLEKNSRAGTALRDSLEALIRLVGKAQPVMENEPLLVPSRNKERRGLSYLRLGTLVFVLERAETLVGCYELRGKNFQRMLRQELTALARNCRGHRIGAFELPKGRSKYLGSIEIKNEHYLVHPRAFSQFLDSIRGSAALRESFAGGFTVADCIKKMPYIFASSERVEPRQIANYLEKNAPRGARYRVRDEWIFVILGKNVIAGCISKRGAGRHARPKH